MQDYSYTEKNDCSQYFIPQESQQYILVTSQTVFEIELLKQFSACTFESQAKVYNSLHEKEDQERLNEFVQNFRRSNIHERQDSYNWLLNVTRLEEGWFMYQLILTFNALGILGAHNFAVYNNGNRRDIELFCQKAMLKVGSPHLQSTWMQRRYDYHRWQ